jgi:glycosyltransferase involved in cell wall biosynthesis
MKKILYAVTKSNFGGAQKYVYELAMRSKEQGFNVHVACGGNGLMKTKLEQAGIPVHSLDKAARDISITKEISVLFQLSKIVRELRPDIMHVNSPKLGGLGSVIGRFHGVKKVIYTNHGWPFMEDRPIWQVILIKFFSWLTLMFAHMTIVLSQKEFDMVKKWPFVGDKKLIIVRNGIHAFDLLPKEEALEKLLCANPKDNMSALSSEEKFIELAKRNARVLGMNAELHKNKGITYALEGLKLYKDLLGSNMNTHLLIVSDGEEKLNLIDLAKSLGLQEDVTFAGYVIDARTYMKAFDLFLLSSVKEGLPYTIIEAGFAKVPVISTNVGGIGEVIENLKTGFLIKPKRAQEIKNTLNYIDDHGGEERQYAELLYEKIRAEYDFEKQYQKLLVVMNG